MLKKFVSSILAVLLLAGCSSKPASTKESAKTAESSESDVAAVQADTLKDANAILDELELTDSMTQVKDRVVLGMFFNGDQDAFVAGSAFLASDTGKTDAVGVFTTNDVDACKDYLNQYLDSAKAQAESYYPEEVFKISNAIVADNGKKVIFVICDDIEKAKKKVDSLLG